MSFTFASTRCIQLQPEHHCLFVCSPPSHFLGPQPPFPSSLYAPYPIFFSRQRDFFIPARYPRGLDSLTLRGQKKEEGGGEGEKKGWREIEREREKRKNSPRPFVVGAEVLFAVETTSKTVQG